MENKPLLIQVVPTLGGGGAEREIARVSKVLNERGPFQVAVCCLMGRGAFADEVEKAGVEVVVLHEKKRFSPIMAWELIKFLRQRKPVIVHSHLVRWGPTAAKLAGVPITIMSEHSASTWRGAMGVLFDRANIHYADKVVAVAEAVREIRIKKWKTPADKVVTIPNALEVEDFALPIDVVAKKADLGIPQDVPVVGIVGRLMPIKGQSYFVDAAAQVLKTRPDCRFLIVGDGPCRESLEKQTRELGIADRVNILGFREDAREIIRVFDIACLSSIAEGMPITILEAMACGKPAVVTKAGGCPEAVIDGITGIVVPPRDPSTLTKAMLNLINDPNLARQMGEAGLQRVKTEYSAEMNLNRLVNLYTDMIKAKGVEGNVRI